MPPSPSRKAARAVAVAALWAAVFFAAGYYAALLAKDPRASLIALAAVSMPLGMTAKSTTRGAIGGFCLGLVGSAGLAWAMMAGRLVHPAMLDRLAVTWSAAITVLTTAIAAVFAHLAMRRRQRSVHN